MTQIRSNFGPCQLSTDWFRRIYGDEAERWADLSPQERWRAQDGRWREYLERVRGRLDDTTDPPDEQ